jgi:hypothetical protein
MRRSGLVLGMLCCMVAIAPASIAQSENESEIRSVAMRQADT